MAKSALANALKERSAKSATQSADVNDSVDEAFEALFGAAAPPAKKKRVTMELPIRAASPVPHLSHRLQAVQSGEFEDACR